jgi:hypothetical protein
MSFGTNCYEEALLYGKSEADSSSPISSGLSSSDWSQVPNNKTLSSVNYKWLYYKSPFVQMKDNLP